MGRLWKKKASRYVAHYRIFHLREDICVSPRTGKELPVYVLETRDWINIIPLTKNREVVMVRQYRFGTEELTLEIPGGLADAEDPSMVEAARRELREETGYDSDQIIKLGKVSPNPAILNNTCHLFLAENVEQKHTQTLDEGEDIQIELVPLDHIPQLVQNGTITHSLVLNAFYFYLLSHLDGQ